METTRPTWYETGLPYLLLLKWFESLSAAVAVVKFINAMDSLSSCRCDLNVNTTKPIPNQLKL